MHKLYNFNLPTTTVKELDQIGEHLEAALAVKINRTDVVRWMAKHVWNQLNRGELTQDEIAAEAKP